MRTMPNDRAKPKRRFLRYSLRTMLVVVLLLSVWLGWMANKAAKQRRAVALVEELGGGVVYDYDVSSTGPKTQKAPLVPEWLRELWGIDFFSTVGAVSFMNELRPSVTVAVTDRQIAQITHGFPNVTHINLGGSAVGDSGLKHLASCEHLVSLVVGDNTTDEGLRHLRDYPSLTELHLINVPITDAGVLQVCQMKQLIFLDLSGTRITDDGLVYVSELPNLQKLLLIGSDATHDGVARLRRQRPNLEVGYSPQGPRWPRPR